MDCLCITSSRDINVKSVLKVVCNVDTDIIGSYFLMLLGMWYNSNKVLPLFVIELFANWLEHALWKSVTFQMRKFYENIEHEKKQELLQDIQNRKHHDTLLPTQKSPIPLNRYEEMDSSGGGGGPVPQVITPQSTLNRSTSNTYKMVARALYNFQVCYILIP